MTSKEALNELVGITVLLNGACSNMINCIKGKKCIYNKPCETCYDHNLIMTIKKDLEVLELLKREMFNENQSFDLDNGWYDDTFSFSKDEQKKIKEVLVDEK